MPTKNKADTYQAPTGHELRAALYEAAQTLERIEGSGSTDAGADYASAEAARILPAINSLLRGERHERMVVLVVSTAHVTRRTHEELEAAEERARLVWRYGSIVFVPAEDDGGDDNEDLCKVFAFCRKHGYEWVRFDSDGPRIADLPTYDWT